ncbi:MAG: Type III secretion system inner membrane R protein [Synergistales bacterium 53_16]|jgi:flagellar biosynthetic protein FliR|nr:MAG: Type III secretion system inner membrane R protein [Synergistales bacterium 53_16]
MMELSLPADFTALILVFLMASLRFLGLLSALVFLGGASLPLPVRLWLSMVLALASQKVITGAEIDLVVLSNIFGLAITSAREFCVGLLLGALASSPLYALQIAGRFVGQQMGFAMANLMDPLSRQQVSVIGQLKYLVGTWFWFYLGGHLIMTAAVVESLKTLPVGTPIFSLLSAGGIRLWINELFLLALKVVLPYFGALFLAEVGLGFIARTVPQLNVFMLGFPIKILLALFLLALLTMALVKGLLPGAIRNFLMMFHVFFQG